MPRRCQLRLPPTAVVQRSISTQELLTRFQPVLLSCRNARPSSLVESQRVFENNFLYGNQVLFSTCCVVSLPSPTVEHAFPRLFRNSDGCRDHRSQCAGDRKSTGCRRGRRATKRLWCSARSIARSHLDAHKVVCAFAFQL